MVFKKGAFFCVQVYILSYQVPGLVASENSERLLDGFIHEAYQCLDFLSCFGRYILRYTYKGSPLPFHSKYANPLFMFNCMF